MRWLVDGYNVIRRSPELISAERRSLAEGREALCRLLADAARVSGDQFTVVFDGSRAGGAAAGVGGVRVIYSSARETADRVLARMAGSAGAVVSSDREVRAAATRAGAIAVGADEFLDRLARARGARRGTSLEDRGAVDPAGKDEEEEVRRPPKGNPRRQPKRLRARNRALGRLDRPR